MFLRHMLFNIGEIADQFLISLYGSEVLQVTRSLTTMFVVLIHDNAVDEVSFRKSLEQMQHTVMRNAKQFRGSPQLNEFL